MRRGFLPLFLVTCLTALAGTAAAQEGENPPAAAAKSDFEKTQRLEALRYRHLWIAYGAAWLIIFGFAWRTWRRAEQTDTELGELKRRIEQMEGTKNG